MLVLVRLCNQKSRGQQFSITQTSKSTTDVGSRKWQSSVDNAEGRSSKRLQSGGNEQHRAGSKNQGHLSKMNEVKGTIQVLKNCRGESKVYSTEQIRVWAHMIQMKQHLMMTP